MGCGTDLLPLTFQTFATYPAYVKLQAFQFNFQNVRKNIVTPRVFTQGKSVCCNDTVRSTSLLPWAEPDGRARPACRYNFHGRLFLTLFLFGGANKTTVLRATSDSNHNKAFILLWQLVVHQKCVSSCSHLWKWLSHFPALQSLFPTNNFYQLTIFSADSQ